MRRRQPLPNENQNRDTSTKNTASTDLENTKMSRIRNVKPMDIATSLEVASGSASTKSFSMIPTKNYSQRQKVLLGLVCFCFVWSLMTGKNNNKTSLATNSISSCFRFPAKNPWGVPLFIIIGGISLELHPKYYFRRETPLQKLIPRPARLPDSGEWWVIFQNRCFASQTVWIQKNSMP